MNTRGSKSKVCSGIALLISAILGPNSIAGIVISIDKKEAHAGESVLLAVYASSDSGDSISGFNLPFDYNSDGFVDTNNDRIGELPEGFSFGANDGLGNILFADTKLERPFPQISLINVDAIATGSGSNVQLQSSTNPTKLFELTIQIASNVPVGTLLPFQIKVPEQPFSSLFLVSGPNTPTVLLPVRGTPAVGSITIVAVPEPCSLCLFFAIAISVALWRSKLRAMKLSSCSF